MNILPKTIVDAATDVAILGAILVSLGYPLIANIIWTPTNIYLTWYNYTRKEMAMAKMFAIYTVIALFGVVWLWSK
jgi:hypothetical protein